MQQGEKPTFMELIGSGEVKQPRILQCNVTGVGGRTFNPACEVKELYNEPRKIKKPWGTALLGVFTSPPPFLFFSLWQ